MLDRQRAVHLITVSDLDRSRLEFFTKGKRRKGKKKKGGKEKKGETEISSDGASQEFCGR